MPDMNGTNPGDPLQRGQYTNPNNGMPMSSPGTPGFSGAIQDLLASLAKTFGPHSLTARTPILNNAVAQGDPQPAPLGSQIGQ